MTLSAITRNKLPNFLIFQIAWFAAVFGPVHEHFWAAPVSALMAVLLFLLPSATPRRDLVFVVCVACSGTMIDRIVAYAGGIVFAPAPDNNLLYLAWLFSLWAGFATTLGVSMRVFAKYPQWSAVAGFFAAPLSYVAGQRMGVLEFSAGLPRGVALLAVEWGVLLPILLRQAVRRIAVPSERIVA